ncbi:MAG: hypothetical protein ACD_50C00052G0006 [uncultured bacterium]|nr:MAG: hypothetical protein ACD_50C00052G0006 [uncultured bacterium]OGH14065.1 MAG: hypothetical protein A2687_02260 [Candidatus Levybacteria bacterium RIFCSPHIGHO2_01_FULL_38_26]
MIPQYPDFKKLTLEDKKEIEKRVRQYSPYSDFNFLSLWSYNIDDDIVISDLYGNLVVRFRDYITNEPFYSFIGINNLTKTIDSLLRKSQEEGLKPMLKLIPDIVNKSSPKDTNRFIFEEDRDNFDYIFSVSEIAQLNGNKYHTQKNFVNRFQNLHQNFTISLLDLLNGDVQTQVLNVFHTWKRAKNYDDDHTQRELTALNRTLTSSSDFNLITLGIYNIEKSLIGFIIADLSEGGYAQSHFVKADISYPGVYYTLYFYLAKHLQAMGYEFLNNGQDLGIMGLRKSKEQWNPVVFLKKYKITYL